MKELVVSVLAKADLHSIWNYFSNISEKKAIQAADNLQRRFDDLVSLENIRAFRHDGL